MSADRWSNIERLFHAAQQLPPPARSAFVAAIADPDVRSEIASLLAAGNCPDDSAIARLIGEAADLATGEPMALGHFQVIAELGRGAMGAVYRARDLRLNRDVALKFLSPEFTSDEERTVRFEREATLLASLNHPNIATVHGVENGAIVMEVVEGPTLAERIDRGRLPLREALEVAKQIAEALAYAHARGVVHRDLKPANVKIVPDGRVKILDFGLAKALRSEDCSDSVPAASASASVTVPGFMVGTAAYMAPEQIRGNPVDQRADVWAFGVVLYEMLAARRPFDGDTVSDTLAKALTAEPDLTRVPPPVHRLLRACLEKEPHDRLHSIADYRLLLDDAPHPSRRRSVAPWVAVAGLLAAAAAFMWWRGVPAANPSFTQFDVDLGGAALPGPNTTIAISPDGSRIVFAASGAGGTPQLAVRLLGQPAPTLLAGTDRGADPFFSPDGRWIGFFADRKLKKIPVDGGTVITVCDAAVPRGAAWGADGHIILMPVAGAFGLSRVPATGGTPQVLTRPSERGEVTHRWPQILPDGDTVLFTASAAVGISYDDATIDALSLKTGEWKVVQRGGYFGRYVPGGYLVYVHQGTLLGVKFDLRRLEVTGTPVPLLEDVGGNAGTGAGQFDIAGNGTFVYRKSGASAVTWPLLWLEENGTTRPLLQTRGSYLAPRFSPDGKRLALTVGLTDIRIYDWERDTMRRVGFTNQRNAFPVWAPDGRHIVFESQALGGSLLYWIRADGAAEPQLLLRSKSDIRPYSFSPDGRYLAFSEQDADAGFSVGTLPLDLTDPERPRPGTPEPFVRTRFASEPAFSPDGRWIAYASNESGAREVYVQPFPGHGSASGKWQVSSGGGRSPIWSTNGRELFYENDEDRIMAVDYSATGDSFAGEKPRVWSRTQLYHPNAAFWNLALAPDGKRFAIVPRSETGGETLHITFLLNFFDEVRRRHASHS